MFATVDTISTFQQSFSANRPSEPFPPFLLKCVWHVFQLLFFHFFILDCPHSIYDVGRPLGRGGFFFGRAGAGHRSKIRINT